MSDCLEHLWHLGESSGESARDNGLTNRCHEPQLASIAFLFVGLRRCRILVPLYVRFHKLATSA
jgi:hypothetical protein